MRAAGSLLLTASPVGLPIGLDSKRIVLLFSQKLSHSVLPLSLAFALRRSPALAPVLSLLCLTMASIEDTVRLLFEGGSVGPKLIEKHRMPSSLAEGWNQDIFLPDQQAKHPQLLESMAHASPKETSLNSTFSAASSLRSDFLELNLMALRLSATHRVWSPADAFALHQRLTFGCSLLLLSFLREDGSQTPPLLIIAGPMAIPLAGETFDTHRILDLPETEPLPSGGSHSLSSHSRAHLDLSFCIYQGLVLSRASPFPV